MMLFTSHDHWTVLCSLVKENNSVVYHSGHRFLPTGGRYRKLKENSNYTIMSVVYHNKSLLPDSCIYINHDLSLSMENRDFQTT